MTGYKSTLGNIILSYSHVRRFARGSMAFSCNVSGSRGGISSSKRLTSSMSENNLKFAGRSLQRGQTNGGLVIIGETVATLHREIQGSKVRLIFNSYNHLLLNLVNF